MSCKTPAQHNCHLCWWWICGFSTCFCCNNCGNLRECFDDPNKYCDPKGAVAQVDQHRLKVDKEISEINLGLKHIVASLDKQEVEAFAATFVEKKAAT